MANSLNRDFNYYNENQTFHIKWPRSSAAEIAYCKKKILCNNCSLVNQ